MRWSGIVGRLVTGALVVLYNGVRAGVGAGLAEPAAVGFNYWNPTDVTVVYIGGGEYIGVASVLVGDDCAILTPLV